MWRRAKNVIFPSKDSLPTPSVRCATRADSKSIYLSSDARGEFLQLARVDADTLHYTWLTKDIPWDVEEIAVDPHAGHVAFTVNEDGSSALYSLEGDHPKRLAVEPGIITGLEFSPDGGKLGFTLARPDAPADVYSFALADGQLTRWTYSEAGGLACRRRSSRRRASITSRSTAARFRPTSTSRATHRRHTPRPF